MVSNLCFVSFQKGSVKDGLEGTRTRRGEGVRRILGQAWTTGVTVGDPLSIV